MSKTAIAAILAMAHVFKQPFSSSRGEDIAIPVDTKGMMEIAKKDRRNEKALSKQKLRQKRGKRNRSNRGKKR